MTKKSRGLATDNNRDAINGENASDRDQGGDPSSAQPDSANSGANEGAPRTTAPNSDSASDRGWLQEAPGNSARHVDDMSDEEADRAEHVDDMSSSQDDAGSMGDAEIRERLQKQGWRETSAWLAPGAALGGSSATSRGPDSGEENGGESPPKPKSQAAIDKAKEREEDAAHGVKPLGVPAEVRLHPAMSGIGRASRVAAYAKAEIELERMHQSLVRVYSALPGIRAGTAVVAITALDAPTVKPMQPESEQPPKSPPSSPPAGPPKGPGPRPAPPVAPRSAPDVAPASSTGRSFWLHVCLAWGWFWSLAAPAAMALCLLEVSSQTSRVPSVNHAENAK